MPTNAVYKHYIFTLETTKIELPFQTPDYAALPDELKRYIMGAFPSSNPAK